MMRDKSGRIIDNIEIVESEEAPELLTINTIEGDEIVNIDSYVVEEYPTVAFTTNPAQGGLYQIDDKGNLVKVD